MKILLLIAFIFAFFLPTTQAQFENKTYQQESIYLRNSSYIKNGMTRPIGLFGGKIEQEFLDKPMSLPTFEKFKRNRTIANVLSLVGLGSAILAIPAIGNGNEELALSLYLVGLASISVGLPINVKANNDLQQAIWLRNGEILR